MFSSRRPDGIGVANGRLAPPKPTPNCVSSQADPADREHYIAPIAFRGDFSRIEAAVAGMRGAMIVRRDGNYLYAEYRTPLMRFVDDVELLYDPAAGLVHVRSASRLGRRDFGVNRKRIESLRSIIEARG
ncbi:MAG TPA: DUF1499 domain-containing protein [Burkholderiales bacterium]